jgi:2-iminobutanoate/2-iminopropanoate deaminase
MQGSALQVLRISVGEKAVSSKQVVPVPGLKSLGPYSHAVRAGGLLFVSGQAGLDPATGAVAGESFEAQARQAFENLRAAVTAGAGGLKSVVNTSITVADIAFFPELNRLFAEFFPEEPPARMVVQAPLPKGLLISIGCVAAAS